jgi:hypothetical protein
MDMHSAATPQLTTMYAYTNSQYHAKEAVDGVIDGGIDFPSTQEELSMTPVPGMEGDLLTPKKGMEVEEKESYPIPLDDPWAHDYDTDDGDYEPLVLGIKSINLDSIEAPNRSFLMQKLPQEMHPFLAGKCKKDCRMWLWKNEAGRRARALLEKGGQGEETVIKLSKESTLSGNDNRDKKQHFT